MSLWTLNFLSILCNLLVYATNVQRSWCQKHVTFNVTINVFFVLYIMIEKLKKLGNNSDYICVFALTTTTIRPSPIWSCRKLSINIWVTVLSFVMCRFGLLFARNRNAVFVLQRRPFFMVAWNLKNNLSLDKLWAINMLMDSFDAHFLYFDACDRE